MNEDRQPSVDKGYVASTRWTDFLGWGDRGRPSDDDPAENFHEASKNAPSVTPEVSPAGAALETDPTARATTTRPVKRHPGLPFVELPEPVSPDLALGEAIAKRRSRRSFGPDPVSLRGLSTLLNAAYGVTQELETEFGPRHVRSVPSGGALYPLEVYPVVRNVAGLAQGLYHYDPLRAGLEVLHEGPTEDRLGELMIPLPGIPDVAATCGLIVFAAGIFWRTRFKYGQRGYRWTLIEAGHIGQNVVLASEGLGLSALPYGGFWDRKVDDFLGLDGVNESVVYSLAVGSPAPGEDGESSGFS